MKLRILYEAKKLDIDFDTKAAKTAIAGGKDGTPQGGNPYNQIVMKPAFAIQHEPEQNVKTDPPYDTHIQ